CKLCIQNAFTKVVLSLVTEMISKGKNFVNGDFKIFEEIFILYKKFCNCHSRGGGNPDQILI
ncbi:MAG: hypothetical protein AAB437_03850, partial [Patescibacteria group bacterium]